MEIKLLTSHSFIRIHTNSVLGLQYLTSLLQLDSWVYWTVLSCIVDLGLYNLLEGVGMEGDGRGGS